MVSLPRNESAWEADKQQTGIVTNIHSNESELVSCGPIVAALAAAGVELYQCVSSYRDTEIDSARLRQTAIAPSATDLLAALTKMEPSDYDLFALPPNVVDRTNPTTKSLITPKKPDLHERQDIRYYIKFLAKCNVHRNMFGKDFASNARVVFFQYNGLKTTLDTKAPKVEEKDKETKRPSYSVYISKSIIHDIFKETPHVVLFDGQSAPIEYRIARHIVSVHVRPESTGDVILKLALSVDIPSETDTRVVLYVPDSIGCTIGSEIYLSMDHVDAISTIGAAKIKELCESNKEFETFYITAVSTHCIFQYAYSNPTYVPTVFDALHKTNIRAAIAAMRAIANPPRKRKSLLPFV